MPIGNDFQPSGYIRFLFRRSFTKSSDSTPLAKFRAAWRESKVNWYPIPISLGLAYIAASHFYKVYQRPDDPNSVQTKIEGPFYLRFYASLPLRYLSQWWGWINDLDLPIILRKPVYLTYSYLCGCSLDEMKEQDLTAFSNLGQFFYREIELKMRPIDSQCSIVFLFINFRLPLQMVKFCILEEFKGMKLNR
jgi:phosphatidylserine decarboxylase